jgi:hypothetical protein
MARRLPHPDEIRPPNISIGIYEFRGGSGPYDHPRPDGTHPPGRLRRGVDRLLAVLRRRAVR